MGKEFLTDVSPPGTYLSECDKVGTGSFKRAYVCNKVKTPIVVENIRGENITIGEDFVLYRPSTDITGLASIDEDRAKNLFQSSIGNIQNVNSYDNNLKKFFLKSIDTVKYTENGVEYNTLIVPKMEKLSSIHTDLLIKMTEEYMKALITYFMKDYTEKRLKEIIHMYLPTDVKPDNYLFDRVKGRVLFSDLEFLDRWSLFSRRGMTYTPIYVSKTTEFPFETSLWYYNKQYNNRDPAFNSLNLLRMFVISSINSVLELSGSPIIPKMIMSNNLVSGQLTDTLNSINQYTRFSNIIKHVEVLEFMISGCWDRDTNSDDNIYYDKIIASPELMFGEEARKYSRSRIDMSNNMCFKMTQRDNKLIEGGMEVVGVTDTVDTGNKTSNEELDDDNFFNYILYTEQDPNTLVWTTKIELTRVRAFGVGSRHAHIVLNKIVPQGRRWYYIASGEICRRGGPVSGDAYYNLNSTIFQHSWNKVNIANLLNSFLLNANSMNNSKAIKLFIVSLIQFTHTSYDFMMLFKVIVQFYLTYIKKYPNVSYSTQSFRSMYKPVPLMSTNDPACNTPGFKYTRYDNINDCASGRNGIELCSVEEDEVEKEIREAVNYIINLIKDKRGEDVTREDVMEVILNVPGYGIIDTLDRMGYDDLIQYVGRV